MAKEKTDDRALAKSVVRRANARVIQSGKTDTSLPCREKTVQEIKKAFYKAAMIVSSLK
ncbi:MAG: hypothetical protein LBT15_01490 [Synergistaceae bacterium]|jgi:hypothetical protein|nr:hypothetical protein [Synergistaceae bacterium]